MSDRYKETLTYWIQERWNIYKFRQENNMSIPPWSADPVFQTTYFCNVHRENDKVTKWIRENWTMENVGSINYELWMVVARFLNWPDTLELVCSNIVEDLDREDVQFTSLQKAMEDIAAMGMKVWGNAYVITSHGMKMPKVEYLCQHLLPDVYMALPAIRAACRKIGYSTPNEAIEAAKLVPKGTHAGTCAAAAAALQRVPGIGSFLAGQIVADLKNTVGHPLYNAPDKKTFVIPGPGSIRGLNWFLWGNPDGPVTERNFISEFRRVRQYVDQMPDTGIPHIDNQDLQNCLCEFSKYCKVKTGTGRSKRKYHGY